MESSAEELKYGLRKEMQLTSKLLTFQVQGSKREVKEATAVIIYDADFLEEISPFVEVISTDATFNSFPDLHVHKGQFMTIMVQLRTDNDCQKAIPCAWVLMNNKSTCYLRVFKFLADNFKNFKPKYSMTDYEIALRNSLKEIFPGIQTKTCYFHYSQAVIKNAQEKKLIDKDNCKEERPELFIFLNRLKLLALLPAELIESVYEKIKKECLNDFGDCCSDYLNYYEKQWLKQEGAEQISVYRLRNRTNNFLESYHKQLNAVLPKRPKHNVFVGKYFILS
ncbi:GSCOCG00011996001-RA-CDS [Cotesia congregata]|nr:GSCOCG00011996001-RA-CDS [Cotesia congregata]